MLTVDIALPDVEELHKLVQDGQEKGFLTYDEIASALDDVELTKEQIDDFACKPLVNRRGETVGEVLAEPE